MVLGQPTKTLIHPDINPFKRLSGQRALKKTDLMPLIEKMKTVRYGVETLINIHYKTMHKKSKICLSGKFITPQQISKNKISYSYKGIYNGRLSNIRNYFHNF